MSKIDHKYLKFLTKRRENRPLKIPRHLSEIILQDKKLMKALCIWLELKPLFYDGRFKAGKKRQSTLARYLYMSESAFRYKLKRLINSGFAQFDNDGDLLLCSWENFFLLLGSEKSKRHFQYYRLQNKYANSEFLLRYYAVQENFELQEKTIEKKIFNAHVKEGEQFALLKQLQEAHQRNDIALEDRQRIISRLSNQIQNANFTRRDYSRLQSLKSKGKFAKLYVEKCGEYFKEIRQMNNKPNINFDISISCKRMAQIYGLSSAGAGHYWQQLMKDHFFKIKPRTLWVKGSSFQLRVEQKNDSLYGHFFQGSKSREFFKRLNNHIELLPLERFQRA